MGRCTFTSTYQDYQTKRPSSFECDQEPLENKEFCLFHDEDFLRGNDPEHKALVISVLDNRIAESITNNKSLFCIGYMLPNVVIKKKFIQPVYFNACKFQAAIFSGTTFSAEVTFQDAIFSSTADFSSTNFQSKAIFIGTRFLGESYFFNSTFQRVNFTDANFIDTVRFSVIEHDEIQLKANFNGRAEFSKAVFFNKAIFAGCKFLDIAVFDQTTFKDDADFHRSEFIDQKVISFASAIFSKDSNFLDSKLLGSEVNFLDVTFIGKAYFSPVTFADNSSVVFSGANFFSSSFFGEVGFPSTTFFDGCTFHSTAYFSGCTFSGNTLVDFSGCTFSSLANFEKSTFSSKVDFSYSKFFQEAKFSSIFEKEVFFNNITLEKPNEVTFDADNMSQVSFLNTDISKVRFGDKTRWGGKDGFKVIEEEWFEKQIIAFDENRETISLNGLLSVYRNLRESYEFRRRYDEAGKFFIKEMEIKRKYKHIHPENEDDKFPFKRKNWLERNIFSLTGWYHILSDYGESLKRPSIAGVVIVAIFTLFFIMQSNPYQEPFSNVFDSDTSTNMTNSSKFIGFDQIGNGSHDLKAFVRTMGDFLPILSMPNDIKIGLIDYLIKIFGGAITFGLIVIALRRRFERKYYH